MASLQATLRPQNLGNAAGPMRRMPASAAARRTPARRTLLRPAASLPPLPPMGGPTGPEFEANNKRYAELTAALETAAGVAQEGLQGTSIYLVGMMGSGKSTVGKLVSQALGYCHFDTDALIEQLAGKGIPEIFAEDGEEDFRAIETQVLMELAPFKNCIVSTGGGAPTRSMNWGHMSGGISVWLNGTPELLARRVVHDGTENRPLLAGSDAADGDEELQQTVAKLTRLLEERRAQYEYADIMVSLEGEDPATADFGAPAAAVALRVLQAINDRIARDSAAREGRKRFEVINDNLPDSMRVVQSINPVSGDPDPYMP